MIESPLFEPVRIGPVTLRNRIIRSAAFENMAYGNSPSQDLYDYHVAVSRGGVGMTTLAYASVSRSGVWERSSSLTPNSFSSRSTCWLR